MNLMKKMSVNGMNGLRGGFKGVTEQRHVGRIVGIAHEVDYKESQTMGISKRFTGEFRGINEHGEEFAAPVCYLPAPADGLLEAAVNAAEGKGVNFAFDFFVVPNATSILGYDWKVKPLLDTRPSDPLAALMGSIPPMLAAPKKAEETVAPTEAPAVTPAPTADRRKTK